MMRKYRSVAVFLLCILCFFATPVNADNKINAGRPAIKVDEIEEMLSKVNFENKPQQPPLTPGFVGYAGIMGLIKENQWYWVTPGNLSYAIDANDIFKKYEFSEIYEQADSHALPMQFTKVGEKYLPSIELGYVTLSGNRVALESIKNLPQYRTLLEAQDVVYIDLITGQIIPRDKAALSCCYMYIKKDDEKLNAMEISRVLYKATEYTYYPSEVLKSRTVYRYLYEGGENNHRIQVTSETYKDSKAFGMIDKMEPRFIDVQDIPNNTLRPLFQENKKLKNK